MITILIAFFIILITIMSVLHFNRKQTKRIKQAKSTENTIEKSVKDLQDKIATLQNDVSALKTKLETMEKEEEIAAQKLEEKISQQNEEKVPEKTDEKTPKNIQIAPIKQPLGKQTKQPISIPLTANILNTYPQGKVAKQTEISKQTKSKEPSIEDFGGFAAFTPSNAMITSDRQNDTKQPFIFGQIKQTKQTNLNNN